MSALRAICVAVIAILGFTLEIRGEPPAQEGQPARAKKVRVDLYGDPLPGGAIARLGTVRFRHGDRILSVCLSPDGKKVASAGEDGVILWDTFTGTEVCQFQGHERYV